MKTYLGVTFADGKKELFVADSMKVYTNIESAKMNSMDFSFTRCESADGQSWEWFYRGNKVQVTIIRTEYHC